MKESLWPKYVIQVANGAAPLGLLVGNLDAKGGFNLFEQIDRPPFWVEVK